MTSPKQITIRNPSEELTKKLRSLSKARNESLNTTILSLLESVLGVNGRRKRLERYVTWTKEDLAEFEDALTSQRVIDDNLWK